MADQKKQIAFSPFTEFPPNSMEAKKIVALRSALIHYAKELGVGFSGYPVYYSDATIRAKDCKDGRPIVVISRDRITIYYFYHDYTISFCENVYSSVPRFLRAMAGHHENAMDVLCSGPVEEASRILFGEEVFPEFYPQIALIGEWSAGLIGGRETRYIFRKDSFVRTERDVNVVFGFKVVRSRGRSIHIRAIHIKSGTSHDYFIYFDDSLSFELRFNGVSANCRKCAGT